MTIADVRRAVGLATRECLPAGASDADLLDTVAKLLAAMPGPTCGAPLSGVFELVCRAHEGTADRAEQLEGELADYLHEWRVLRAEQTSPAGLDAWANTAPVAFLRAAVAGCARCQRTGAAR